MEEPGAQASADKWLGVVLSPVFNSLINGPEESSLVNEPCRWLLQGQGCKGNNGLPGRAPSSVGVQGSISLRTHPGRCRPERRIYRVIGLRLPKLTAQGTFD